MGQGGGPGRPTVQQFQAKWRNSRLTERSAAQQHFLDLCRLLGMPTPAEADQEGAFYTFEKSARKVGGGQGFADVRWSDRFAWEYKRNRATLDAAYAQLLQYREDLGNPPILVVSDLQRFQVHTNFTGTAKRTYEFTLDDLDQPDNLAVLRKVFTDPYALRPDTTVEAVTEEAATRFGALAGALHARDVALIAHELPAGTLRTDGTKLMDAARSYKRRWPQEVHIYTSLDASVVIASARRFG